jgi:hypothetical protein
VARTSQEQKLLSSSWTQAAMCLIFVGIAYGFASLAIDSGNLIEYALTIFFFVWAIKSAVRAVRNL